MTDKKINIDLLVLQGNKTEKKFEALRTHSSH